jgi:raffinose/stachyose/melibiose transport system permease protein
MAETVTALPTAGAAVKKRRYIDRKAWPALLVFVVPSLVVFTIFFVLPMIDAGGFSFFDWSGYGPMTDFIGWKNYQDVLFHRNFGTSVRNSLLVVVISLLIQLPLALWVALALSKKSWVTNLFRVLFFLPYMLAEVAAGLIWRFVYDGDYGLMPALGGVIGQKMPYVLADQFWVMPAILVVIVWKYFGFHMMIYIAGLQAIPGEVIEAARLDGVKRWQIAWHIRIPMIWSSIVVSMFFSILGALQLFDVIIPLSKGGPNNTSHTIVTFLYQFGILRMKLGFGGAVSVILFLTCCVFTLVYRRVLSSAQATTQ